MSTVIDPTKGARRAAKEQAKLLKQQKQKQQLAKAEAEDELARVQARATSPMMGRRSLISGTQRRETLG